MIRMSRIFDITSRAHDASQSIIITSRRMGDAKRGIRRAGATQEKGDERTGKGKRGEKD